MFRIKFWNPCGVILAICGNICPVLAAEVVAKPDFIVSDFQLRTGEFVVEIQNQGPGLGDKDATIDVEVSTTRRTYVVDPETKKAKVVMAPVALNFKIPVPRDVFGCEELQIPFLRFDVATPEDLSPMFKVTLDAKKLLAEERKHNNEYWRQVDVTGRVIPPLRGEYKPTTDLPDLVITDIVHSPPYLVAHYKNQGKGATGADFLLLFKTKKADFSGNSYYRFRVPAPGAETKTGGVTLGLLKIAVGDEVEVEAHIDFEDRVHESDKSNNKFVKTVKIEPLAK